MKDDNLPEPRESFEITLVSVSSGDGSKGSTNTSGASIDLTNSVFSFVIEKNDNANGLLQFSNSSTPPQPSDGIIPPATERPMVRQVSSAIVECLHNEICYFLVLLLYSRL